MHEQDKHSQLSDFGGIPGAPSGPPTTGKCAAENSEQSHAPSRKTDPLPEIHPAANIFPPMNEHELAALLDDMKLNGQREAIWIFEGKVIDGRNRLRVCQMLNLEPKFREWDGNGSLVAFVLSLNLHRRHLN
jgi:hypothetical protein